MHCTTAYIHETGPGQGLGTLFPSMSSKGKATLQTCQAGMNAEDINNHILLSNCSPRDQSINELPVVCLVFQGLEITAVTLKKNTASLMMFMVASVSCDVYIIKKPHTCMLGHTSVIIQVHMLEL